MQPAGTNEAAEAAVPTIVSGARIPTSVNTHVAADMTITEVSKAIDAVPEWAPAADGSSQAKQASYATFTKYVPGEPRTKTEALFVPAGASVSKSKLLDLIKKTWKLPLPNLLIACDAGMAHPTTLATQELCMLKQFDTWIASADKHVRRAALNTLAAAADQKLEVARELVNTPVPAVAGLSTEPAPGLAAGKDSGAGVLSASPPSTPPPSPPSPRGLRGARARITPYEPPWQRPPPDAPTLGIVQKLLFQKLRTVFAAIVEAAAMSNNWIVVDRMSCKSPTAEYLLELALSQASQRPTVVVIDSEDRLQNFLAESEKGVTSRAYEQRRRFDELKAQASPLGSDLVGSRSTVEWLYHPSEFIDAHSYDHMPLPREPEDAHRDPATGKVYPEMVWWYHYLQTYYASGTHYIILEKGEDGFDLSATCGPLGFVCAHGGLMMYDRLAARIQSGMPLVMLHNSGGITQCFGSLIRAITRFPHMEAAGLLDQGASPHGVGSDFAEKDARKRASFRNFGGRSRRVQFESSADHGAWRSRRHPCLIPLFDWSHGTVVQYTREQRVAPASGARAVGLCQPSVQPTLW